MQNRDSAVDGEEPGGEPAEDTIVRDRAAPSRSGYAIAGAPSEDVDDTIIRLIQPHAAASTRQQTPHLTNAPSAVAPAVPAAETAAPPPAHIAWLLRIRGTDVLIPLDRPVVVGRDPRAPRVDEVRSARRVQIPAQHRDVSARHARIEQTGDALVVTDLGSTNGIDVHWADGSVRRLRPRETTVVLPEAVVAIGEAVVLDFVTAPTT